MFPCPPTDLDRGQHNSQLRQKQYNNTFLAISGHISTLILV